MYYTDPTYLRTIHDGLLSGTIHKDNASTLPIGLIGIYEEALPPSSNANEIKKLLEFFAVWALLKKEVSSAFVVQLLEGWTEEHVLDYISQYSKWFNSPVSGKYVLYHERLRSFVIQKISQGHFTACNESIIQNCQTALQAKSGDEWERYALEHLSTHFLIQAMKSGDATALKALAYNIAHWNRQVEISKGFEWSKRMLDDMMLWASKYDDDEVIECLLNKVDLHHLEQNDAPRIVELVAQNDIETALQRIESFGGNDQEGLKRKFLLYMLCLIELTIEDSRDKPFRRNAIEKLLKHLDENLPINRSVLNWNDFFPSYLIFQMACEWAEMGLDYLIVYRRTDDWEKDWILDKGSYSDFQFYILVQSACEIYSESCKSEALRNISMEMIKHGKIDDSLACARIMSNLYEKDATLAAISTEKFKQGKIEEANALLLEALKSTREISIETIKKNSLVDIAYEMLKQEKTNESDAIMAESINCIEKQYTNSSELETGMEDNILEDILSSLCLTDKGYELRNNLLDLYAQNDRISLKKKLIESISYNFESQKKFVDPIFYLELYNEYVNNRNIKEAGKIIIQFAINITHEISDEFEKCQILVKLSLKLAQNGLIEESILVIREISEENLTEKIIAMSTISTELSIIGLKIESNDILNEALHNAQAISSDRLKGVVMKGISIEIAKQGKFNEALLYIDEISNELIKCEAKASVSTQFFKQDSEEKAISLITESKILAYEISDELDRYLALASISSELAIQGKFDEALYIANEISDKGTVLKNISISLAYYGKIEDSLDCASRISFDSELDSSHQYIAVELGKHGDLPFAEEIGLKIHNIKKRQSCWRELAENSFKEIGWHKTIHQLSLLKNADVKTYYLYGLADSITSLELNKELILNSQSYYLDDIATMENLLQKNALHELFFGDESSEKIERFKRTLNIQWAIEIKEAIDNV